MSHQAEVGTAAGHQLAQQAGLVRLAEAVEDRDGGVRDGSTEACDLLLVARRRIINGELPCRHAIGIAVS